MAERTARANLFESPAGPLAEELVELVAGGDGVSIERIVSTGQTTPVGHWLDQPRDEWVLLLDGEAELVYDDGSRLRLGSGDHVLIPAGKRHRVEWTRSDPPCIWLAVHADDLRATEESR